MKLSYFLFFFTTLIWSCSNTQIQKEKSTSVTSINIDTLKTFTHVFEFPTIKDSAQFIIDLRKTFKIEIEESLEQKENEKITTFRKIKLYGSDNEYYFIEYDWNVGCMAGYPWKCQLLLTNEGKLIKTMFGQRFDFVTILKNQNPFLLLVTATANGNGGHNFYKITKDTLENIYDGNIQTYDECEDMEIYSPYELDLKFYDVNKDGYNDIVFTGQKLMLGKYTKDSLWYDIENDKPFTTENPAKKINLKYVFLYNKKTGHFRPKENYK